MDKLRVDGFFYGLFMDTDILLEYKVSALNPRQTYVEDFALCIGNRATLIPKSGARSYGMLFSLTFDDLDRLYNAPGLEQYRPEPVLVHTFDGHQFPALCYNLLETPKPDETNAAYAKKLREVLTQLKFPGDYIDSIS